MKDLNLFNESCFRANFGYLIVKCLKVLKEALVTGLVGQGGCNDKFGLKSPFYCFNVK